MRKGQELALSTIVIAVIVLLVLLVLGIILTRQTGTFSTGLSGCLQKGGTCTPETSPCALRAPQYECKGTTGTCCLDQKTTTG